MEIIKTSRTNAPAATPYTQVFSFPSAQRSTQHTLTINTLLHIVRRKEEIWVIHINIGWKSDTFLRHTSMVRKYQLVTESLMENRALNTSVQYRMEEGVHFKMCDRNKSFFLPNVFYFSALSAALPNSCLHRLLFLSLFFSTPVSSFLYYLLLKFTNFQGFQGPMVIMSYRSPCFLYWCFAVSSPFWLSLIPK